MIARGEKVQNNPFRTRYAAAIASLALGLLGRWALTPIIETRFPYFSVDIAILVSARYFGLGPSVLAAVLGGPTAFYLFGNHQLAPSSISVGLVFYFIIAATAIWLMEMQRRAHGHAEENARLADERLAELQQEIARRESGQKLAAQLQAIVESSEDAILSKDLDGKIQSWNRAAERIFGFTAEEMAGQSISILVPAAREDEESGIIDVLRGGGGVKHFETVRLRRDGEPIEVSLTISPIRNPEGKIIGASHTARDITEQKELERQLREAQKLESLGVLAGGLAHDFNNLLTGILGNASLVLDELEEGDRVRPRIEEIVSASERAALLVGQMLAYAGKGRFVVELLDLSEQIAGIAPLIRTSVPRQVELDLRLESGLPPIEADRSHIQQVIMNLAINGAEAVGEGPGSVTITARASGSAGACEVVLEVQDTGCGMDEETKARIFDPFFSTKFTGRGLGLAAALGIIRAHAASISVQTAPGRGSTFTVRFRAAARKMAAA